jgi:hypothetical protein
VSAEVVFAATLRIGVHFGLTIGSEQNPVGIVGLEDAQFRAGLEVAVFADVAEFITSVTYVPKRKGCELKVEQVYNLALGAIAGAYIKVDAPSLRINSRSWGPDNKVYTAVFTKTLANICATSKTRTIPEVSMTAANKNRRDPTTTSFGSEITGGAVECLPTDTDGCPISLHDTASDAYKRPFGKVAASATRSAFTGSAVSGVRSLKSFGANAKSIKATSGKPVAYTEASPTPTHHNLDLVTGGGTNRKLAIGLGVGLGIPLLAAIVGAFMLVQSAYR